MPKLISLFALLASLSLSIATPTGSVLEKRDEMPINMQTDTVTCGDRVYGRRDFANVQTAFLDYANSDNDGNDPKIYETNIIHGYYTGTTGPYYRHPIVKNGKYPEKRHNGIDYALVSSTFKVVAVEMDTDIGFIPCIIN